MEISLLLLTLISAIVATIISKTLKNRHGPRRKLPPGPNPWPVIGNLNLLGSIPHQSLHHLSQKYGEIMLLKFGKFPVVIASSPKMAEQFLKVHDAVFAGRPKLIAGKYMSFNYSDVSFAPFGPYWRGARKILKSEFLNPKKLESLEHIRVEERLSFLRSLRTQSSAQKPVLIRDHLSRFSLSTICRMVMTGKYFSSSDEEKAILDMDELQEIINEWFTLNGAFNVGDWIPWLGFLDLQGYVKKMTALREKMDRFCDFVIDDHLAKRVGGEDDGKKDFVDNLLEIAEDPNCEIEFTRDCVKALMMNLLEGGSDTSATTIEWAVHELLRQPRIIEKAKEELDRVIGRNRWVEESDIIQLPYIDAIIKETFRLHALATFLAPHYATHDCNVAGYDISKGTMVLINIWSIGRNPTLWDSVEEFLPERFLGKDVEITESNNFSLFPFGSGRRKCPGYDLGLKLVRTTLANLLHGFEMKLEGGMRVEDICMEEKYGLTTKPKEPLSIILKPTLPDHLY